ncbi:hypothetical protein J25TS5_24600 [Paenibacillus faecis]|nr:hypothetical protein J25TS5_24600 [Paenibacillus faecis]
MRQILTSGNQLPGKAPAKLAENGPKPPCGGGLTVEIPGNFEIREIRTELAGGFPVNVLRSGHPVSQ